jgi:penicillin-binding protein 1A
MKENKGYKGLIRMVIRLTVFSMATALLFIAVAVIFILSVKNGKYGELPDYKELQNVRNNVASEIYSADSVLLGKYYLVNRTNAAYDEIPPHIIHALVATEDVRFFEHKGIDKRSLLRVLVKSILLRNESSGGGSTISQQLAKNLYGRKKYPHMSMAINKIKEAIIAQRLESVYSKQEILTLYLNTVSFGENVYGIETAAERYFSLKPNNLTLNEAAVLVGMLKATGNYNPRVHPEKATKRRNIVLNQMVKYGYLNRETAEKAKQEPLNLRYNNITHVNGPAPYFRETIRLEIQRMLKQHLKADSTPYNLYTDGLKIYTTINSKAQQYAEDAVRVNIQRLQEKFFKHWNNKLTDKLSEKAIKPVILRTQRYKELKEKNLSEEQIESIFNTPVKMSVYAPEGEKETEMSPLDSIKYYRQFLSAGFLAMEAQTGRVLAWVGGIDYKHFKYDHIRSRRQVGSTFKPLVYAAAIEQGIDPCHYFSNERAVYEDKEFWSPGNSDGDYRGYYTMQGALMKSINTVTAKIMMQTGTEPVVRLAKRLGISGDLPEVPAISLGTADISLEEMVSAYSVFPNMGYKARPIYIEKIEDAEGKTIIDNSSGGKSKTKAMKESTAALINHFLRSVVDSGTAVGLRRFHGLKNEMAGKTGTTQKQADGWFIGYTPDIVVGVWVGHDDPRVHFKTPGLGYGSRTAMPIFADFFKSMLSDPEFSALAKSKFPPLSSELKEKTDCPPFTEEIKEMPKDVIEFFFGPSKEKVKKERKPKVPKQNEAVKKQSFGEKLKRMFGRKE